MFYTRGSLVSGKIIKISFYVVHVYVPLRKLSLNCKPMLWVGISLVIIADLFVQFIVIGSMLLHAYVLRFGISLVRYLLRPT
jgi:hypothetical protein